MKKKAKKQNSQLQTFKSGEVMSMLENMNDGIKVIAETQGDVIKRLDNLESDVKVVKADINIIKSDITEIKFELKRKVSYDEFEKLEKRVVRLEKLGFAR
jgi:hypothetical protein